MVKEKKKLTHKEKGWTYIRIKIDTAKELKLEKLHGDFLLYDDLIKKMIINWRKK